MVERRIRNAQVAGSIPADGSIFDMSKESINSILRSVKGNRSVLWMLGGVFAGALICGILISVSIQPSDVTVYTRYSAFGQIHFYKDHWQYFFTFVALNWLIAIIHGGLIIKFALLERMQTAKVLTGYTVVLLVILAAYALSVFSLGQAA